jgi:hypothetical protein
MSEDAKWLATTIGSMVAIVAVIGLVICLGVRQFAYAIDSRSCVAFGETSGYEVRFAEYTWLTWDCLARIDSDRWVSTDNLRGVNQ